jgi:hypothetical protein
MTIWLVPEEMRTDNAGQWEKKRKTGNSGGGNRLCEGGTHSALSVVCLQVDFASIIMDNTKEICKRGVIELDRNAVVH